LKKAVQKCAAFFIVCGAGQGTTPLHWSLLFVFYLLTDSRLIKIAARFA
jgi:hypothetical protein